MPPGMSIFFPHRFLRRHRRFSLPFVLAHTMYGTYVHTHSKIIVTVSPGLFATARKATGIREISRKERDRLGQGGLPSLFNCRVYCCGDKRTWNERASR